MEIEIELVLILGEIWSLLLLLFTTLLPHQLFESSKRLVSTLNEIRSSTAQLKLSQFFEYCHWKWFKKICSKKKSYFAIFISYSLQKTLHN